MATCPTDYASYQEEIKTIIFRADDGITIPKMTREEAYELSVDVFIRSVIKEPYKNYECTPAESYFGVATLVMQDALVLKIPLKFPRQRIYYGRVSEAFEQWNAVVNFEHHRSLARDLAAATTVNLGIALGFEVEAPSLCCSLPQPVWRELPLREVYVNVPFGTQYEIETSWLRPVAFSDFCGTFYDGNSKQTDGDKDGGLPPNGIFPNIAPDRANPFNGLPSPTSDSQQGAWSNSKVANIDDLDPKNALGWYYEIIYSYNSVGNNCQHRKAYIYQDCERNDAITSNVSAVTGNVCGRNTFNLTVRQNGVIDFGEEITGFFSVSQPRAFPKPSSFFEVL